MEFKCVFLFKCKVVFKSAHSNSRVPAFSTGIYSISNRNSRFPIYCWYYKNTNWLRKYSRRCNKAMNQCWQASSNSPVSASIQPRSARVCVWQYCAAWKEGWRWAEGGLRKWVGLGKFDDSLDETLSLGQSTSSLSSFTSTLVTSSSCSSFFIITSSFTFKDGNANSTPWTATLP